MINTFNDIISANSELQKIISKEFHNLSNNYEQVEFISPKCETAEIDENKFFVSKLEILKY